MQARILCHILAVLLAMPTLLAGSALAFDVPSLTVKVGYGAGGDSDISARLISRHLARFLPGTPDVIVENVPGGGSMKLAQLMLGAEPTDGSVVGVVNAGIAYAPLFDPANSTFDPLAFGWIGALGRGDNMCVVNRTTGLDAFDKLLSGEVIMGATAKTSSSYTLAALVKNSAGAQFKIVTGFEGKPDVVLAQQRKEVGGNCVTSSRDLEANNFKDEVYPLVRFGSASIAGYEAVPTLQSLITAPDVKAAAALVESSVDYDLPLILPVGTPADILDLYRKAFDAMIVDAEFLKDAETVAGLTLQPTTGLGLEAVIREKYALDPAVIEAARALVQ